MCVCFVLFEPFHNAFIVVFVQFLFLFCSNGCVAQSFLCRGRLDLLITGLRRRVVAAVMDVCQWSGTHPMASSSKPN